MYTTFDVRYKVRGDEDIKHLTFGNNHSTNVNAKQDGKQENMLGKFWVTGHISSIES